MVLTPKVKHLPSPMRSSFILGGGLCGGPDFAGSAYPLEFPVLQWTPLKIHVGFVCTRGYRCLVILLMCCMLHSIGLPSPLLQCSPPKTLALRKAESSIGLLELGEKGEGGGCIPPQD